MRKTLLLLLMLSFPLLMLSFPLDLFGQSEGPWKIGEHRSLGIGSYITLISVQDGWHIWRTAGDGFERCLAFKQAVGSAWPRVGETGPMTGGAGYAVSSGFEILGEPPVYGTFYGKHWWARTWISEANGEISRTTSIRVARGWDGAAVNFEITTTPYQSIMVDMHEATGVVDFTGFLSALEAVDQCIAGLGAAL